MKRFALIAAAASVAALPHAKPAERPVAPIRLDGAHVTHCIKIAPEHIELERQGAARTGQILPLDLQYAAGPEGGHYRVTLWAAAGALSDGPDPLAFDVALGPREARQQQVRVIPASTTGFALTAHIRCVDPGHERVPPAEHRLWITPVAPGVASPATIEKADALSDFRAGAPWPETVKQPSGELLVVLRYRGK